MGKFHPRHKYPQRNGHNAQNENRAYSKEPECLNADDGPITKGKFHPRRKYPQRNGNNVQNENPAYSKEPECLNADDGPVTKGKFHPRRKYPQRNGNNVQNENPAYSKEPECLNADDGLITKGKFHPRRKYPQRNGNVPQDEKPDLGKCVEVLQYSPRDETDKRIHIVQVEKPNSPHHVDLKHGPPPSPTSPSPTPNTPPIKRSYSCPCPSNGISVDIVGPCIICCGVILSTVRGWCDRCKCRHKTEGESISEHSESVSEPVSPSSCKSMHPQIEIPDKGVQYSPINKGDARTHIVQEEKPDLSKKPKPKYDRPIPPRSSSPTSNTPPITPRCDCPSACQRCVVPIVGSCVGCCWVIVSNLKDCCCGRCDRCCKRTSQHSSDDSTPPPKPRPPPPSKPMHPQIEIPDKGVQYSPINKGDARTHIVQEEKPDLSKNPKPNYDRPISPRSPLPTSNTPPITPRCDCPSACQRCVVRIVGSCIGCCWVIVSNLKECHCKRCDQCCECISQHSTDDPTPPPKPAPRSPSKPMHPQIEIPDKAVTPALANKQNTPQVIKVQEEHPDLYHMPKSKNSKDPVSEPPPPIDENPDPFKKPTLKNQCDCSDFKSQVEYPDHPKRFLHSNKRDTVYTPLVDQSTQAETIDYPKHHNCPHLQDIWHGKRPLPTRRSIQIEAPDIAKNWTIFNKGDKRIDPSKEHTPQIENPDPAKLFKEMIKKNRKNISQQENPDESKSPRSLSSSRYSERSNHHHVSMSRRHYPTRNFYVRVYKNNDFSRCVHCKSCSMHTILSEATQKLSLSMGARHLFDFTGKEILKPEDIQENRSYYVT